MRLRVGQLRLVLRVSVAALLASAALAACQASVVPPSQDAAVDGGAVHEAGPHGGQDGRANDGRLPGDSSPPSEAAACAPFVPTADQPRYPVGTDAFDPSHFKADPTTGTVTDTATGIVYEDSPVDALTFDQAACRCQGLRTAGATDWRLASRFELVALVDYVKVIVALQGPAFDVTLFPSAPVDYYWTSTLYASGNPAQINLPFYVALGDGTVTGASQTGQEMAAGWCVRGGNAPSTPVRFTTTADTVTDAWTQLVWARAVPPSAQAVDHAGALAYCAGLVLDGAGGFRIPGNKELQTITTAGQRAPAIDTGLFPATPSLLFHTDATYSPQPADTWWFVDFTDGASVPTTVGPSSGRDAEPVRCVRSL